MLNNQKDDLINLRNDINQAIEIYEESGCTKEDVMSLCEIISIIEILIEKYKEKWGEDIYEQ